MGSIWPWKDRAKALFVLFGRSWDSLTEKELRYLGDHAPYAEDSPGVAPKRGKGGNLVCYQRSFNLASDKLKCDLERIERYLILL